MSDEPTTVTSAADNPYDNPEFLEWVKEVRKTLVPMIENSTIGISLVPPDLKTDVKFAVELGYMIMLDKPIVMMVPKGTQLNAKLLAVADDVVEWDPNEPGGLEAAMPQLATILDRIDPEGATDGEEPQEQAAPEA